jgi:hypothetical protein
VAIAPNALPRAFSRRRILGTSCVRTLWKRPLRTSSTGHGLSEFASTSSATRFSPSHEDLSRRLGHASRGYPVPAMAGHEGAPSRQSHHPRNFRTDPLADRDPEPPPPSAWHVPLKPPFRSPAQGCATGRNHRESVKSRRPRADLPAYSLSQFPFVR